MIRLQSENVNFPDPLSLNFKNGVIALGGDLTPKRLWNAYKKGIFPWYNPGEEILWWFTNPRFVLFPEKIKISESLEKILKKQQFSFTQNYCFEEVMKQCQTIRRKGDEGTWISNELIHSFCQLHLEGKAHSYEVWENGALVGGFYGLLVGKVFCGESMFSKVSNASKAGFANFVIQKKGAINLIDCQVQSDYLESFGAEYISGEQFVSYLKQD